MFISSLEKDFCHCSDQTSDLQIDWITIAISPFLVNCLLCETPLFSSKTAHPKIQTSPQKNKFCTKKLSKTSHFIFGEKKIVHILMTLITLKKAFILYCIDFILLIAM